MTQIKQMKQMGKVEKLKVEYHHAAWSPPPSTEGWGNHTAWNVSKEYSVFIRVR